MHGVVVDRLDCRLKRMYGGRHGDEAQWNEWMVNRVGFKTFDNELYGCLLGFDVWVSGTHHVKSLILMCSLI